MLLAPLLAAKCSARPRVPVLIAKAGGYSGELVSILIAGLEGCSFGRERISGRRVLLKPNLVEAASLDEPINTHAFLVRAAVEALMDAADEDRGTGGFDLLRKIYPTCKLITEAGVDDVPEAEILAAYERVIEKRKAA